ncbi:hypothetical protein IE81DRAFT_145996 [Ceraceosorus guamensis]|uniref:Uncharacterized protein n=1 Tax=Ceraceosorus guamensis TaxID=1522189 RepID=A0A316W013_9BASI|nr:hypothetical protein IE81DRAFT_145996 [Ceraceosorus guamensis]PWN42043.1 hypothetical protein IE81DRAFT_145996 [Ceraceosorus guamensis]
MSESVPSPRVTESRHAGKEMERENLRLTEESQFKSLWKQEPRLREEMHRFWEWGYADLDDPHCTRLSWRWWIWRIPALYLVTAPIDEAGRPDSEGPRLHVRSHPLAMASFRGLPSPEELVRLLRPPSDSTSFTKTSARHAQDAQWLRLKPWRSRFSPYGRTSSERSLEAIPRLFGEVSSTALPGINYVPSWAWTALSTGFCTLLLRFLHARNRMPRTSPRNTPARRAGSSRTQR